MPASNQFGQSSSSSLTLKKFRVGDGDRGISATIKLMQGLVYGREGVGSPIVRASAIEAARGTSRGMTEINSIFQWVKDNIEFRGEYAETLQTPVITLQLGAGDCDDHSTLLAALYESLGYETRFNTVSTGGTPDEFSHVFCEVRIKGSDQWVPVDTTVRSSYPGWLPGNIRRTKVRASRPASLRAGGLLSGLLWAAGLYAGANWILKKR